MIERTKMSLAEFKLLPESLEHIELINGELVVSPVPVNSHQNLLGDIYSYLKQIKPNGKVVLSPSDVYFANETVLQPDIFGVREGSKDCQIQDDDYWHGAPDLVVEVLSPATAKRDKTTKYELYQSNGVQEYWIADPYNETLEAYTLENKVYRKLGVFGKEDSFDSPVLGKAVDMSLVF
jgi:Uma2 family endonuclease